MTKKTQPALPAYSRNIKRERKKRGWTHQDLAFRAELSVATISNAERGTRNTDRSTIEAIAGAFGISFVDLEREPVKNGRKS